MERLDPFTLAGVAFFVAGCLLALYVALEPAPAPGVASQSSAGPPPLRRAESTATNEKPPPEPPRGSAPTQHRSKAPRKARRAPVDGWVPNGSRESVATQSVEPDLPAKSTHCREVTDLVGVGKRVGTVVAEQVRAAGRMSVAEEVAIGRKVERELHKVPRFRGKLDLPTDVAKYGPYLNRLLKTLAAHSTRRKELSYRIHIIRDSSFNAFALPGGVLGVHTGLLSGPAAVKDESELVMVLGHEIAHVEHRHPLAAYEAARAVLGSDADLAAVISRMLQLPIHSEYEHEADRRGIALADLCQYDPGAAARLWQRQAKRAPQRRGPGGLVGEVLGTAERMLSTHPPSAQRCARTRAYATKVARQRRWTRYYRGRSNLRDRKTGTQSPR